MSFYPDDAIVPVIWRTKDFLLRPLTTEHVELDHAALMVSKEMLRIWSGSTWPSDTFTVEENWQDLEMHHLEHQERSAFTYTVLSPDEQACLGCVYITPLANQKEANEAILKAVPDFTALVGFWVIQPRLEDGLDKRLLTTLQRWFSEAWAFENVYYNTSDKNQQQQQLFEACGLKKQFALDVRRRSGEFFVYR